MPQETAVKVSKKDLEHREPTDAEQTIINERALKGEPLYEEDREGFVPLANDQAEKAKSLGLPEDASAEDIQAKEQEVAAQEKETLKSKAKELGLPEDATKEQVAEKEAANKGAEPADDQKAFDEADDQLKRDMIAEKELDLEKETDEDAKKALEDTIKVWKETAEKGTGKPPEDGKSLDDQIKTYIEKKKEQGIDVSLEDAKEEIESRQAIIKKYSDDKSELAGAYRSLQRELTKEKEGRIKTEKSLETQILYKPVNARELQPELLLKPKENGASWSRDEVIAKTREIHKEKTEDWDDAAVYELAQDECKKVLENRRQVQLAQIEGEAKARRAELLADIPKEGEPYKDMIKKELDNFPDTRVVEKDFNLWDIIHWARGKEIDKLLKEADMKGFKRGMERRRIAGEISKPSGSTKTNKQASAVKDFGLTDEEKKEALIKFSDNDIPEETKYKYFAYAIGKINSKD